MPNEPTKPPPSSPRELVVVARREAELRVASNGKSVRSLKGYDVSAINELLRAPGRHLRPLFEISEESLKRRARAWEHRHYVKLPDLSIYYRLYAPDKELASLAGQLFRHPVIETTYVKPGAVPPVWRTNMQPAKGTAELFTNDFTDLQGYLGEAEAGGIDARFAWSLPGGDGTGVTIIDIEGAWRFNHEDLIDNQGGMLNGTQTTNLLWRNHGTAVLGVIGGDHNRFGITGICPGAQLKTISKFTADSEQGWGSGAAIHHAANMLSPGDIILIELQYPGPHFNFQERPDQRGYIPVEWWPDNLEAIQYATTRGVIVVEAGGNGRENLNDALYDDPRLPDGGTFTDQWSNPFQRDPIDSGAILIGAGAPPIGTHGETFEVDCSRLAAFSNFGRVIDAQGWGNRVATCGFGNLPPGGTDEDAWYTPDFSGTSSAAAMVAGALGCIQGALKGAYLPPLKPLEVRELLRHPELISPQRADPIHNSPRSKAIGGRPDLRKILAHLIRPS
jgi:hypothetical protein